MPNKIKKLTFSQISTSNIIYKKMRRKKILFRPFRHIVRFFCEKNSLARNIIHSSKIFKMKAKVAVMCHFYVASIICSKENWFVTRKDESVLHHFIAITSRDTKRLYLLLYKKNGCFSKLFFCLIKFYVWILLNGLCRAIKTLGLEQRLRHIIQGQVSHIEITCSLPTLFHSDVLH